MPVYLCISIFWSCFFLSYINIGGLFKTKLFNAKLSNVKPIIGKEWQ